MMRDKKYLNKLKAKAVIEESYEEAKDWKKNSEGGPEGRNNWPKGQRGECSGDQQHGSD
jgi:hypothetical protein